MNKKSNDTIEFDELKSLGFKAIKDCFNVDNAFIESLSNKQLTFLLNKARFGIQLYREFNLNKRNDLRYRFSICNMMATDKRDLKRLLKKSVPEYYIS